MTRAPEGDSTTPRGASGGTSPAPPPAAGPDPLLAARKRGRRYISIAFVSFAAAFMLLSVAQLVMGVFGEGLEIFRQPAPAPIAAGPCADGLRSLQTAVERALGSAAHADTDDRAAADYRTALAPEWDRHEEVERSCNDPQRRDAYAAVLRFRQAGEHLARRQVVELAPLRQDIRAYLPP